MTKLGMEEGEAIEHKMVTKAIENAQRKVEAHNFEMRKHLLEYDDVMNKQREVIYEQRKMILGGAELHDTVIDMAVQVLEDAMAMYSPEQAQPEEWDLPGLKDALSRHFNIDMELDKDNNIKLDGAAFDFATVTYEPLREKLEEMVVAGIESRRNKVGDETWSEIEKYIMLNIVDTNWKDHLLSMDFLKEGIGLRGYAQKNPLNEYKREGSELFMEMLDRIRQDVITTLFHVRVQSDEEARLERRQMARKQESQRRVVESHGEGEKKQETVRRATKKVVRNEPCPCGSGKKYKKCHGAAE